MNQLAHLIMPLSAMAAGSLVGAIWQGTILTACVALCLRFFKGITPGVRSILWTSVLVLVALLHLVPFVHRSAGATAPPGKLYLHLDLRWSLAIACAWVMLSLTRAVQLIHAAIALHRTARRAVPIMPSPECAAILRTCLRRAQLCSSTDVDRPSVLGFFAPRILIPRHLFARISAAELEQIVMHEMEHLRRADDWTNLLQKLSLMLFPLNPVLLFVERRLCVERELACDDRVLQLTRARKAYATCLVNLAEHSLLRRGATLALGAWERQSELARRVHRILTYSEGAAGQGRMRAAAAALMLAMVAGAATLAREPLLVSFVPQASAPAEAALLPASAPRPAALKAAMPGATPGAPGMVDAVFHVPMVPAGVKPHPGKRARPVVQRAAYAAEKTARLPQQRLYVVLTDWTDSSLPSRPRLVSDGVYSYAAVPTSGGWLLFQL